MKTKKKFMMLPMIIMACAIFFIGTSCERTELPIVETSSVEVTGPTTATTGGNVTCDGNASITARGVVWSTTSQTPTTTDNEGKTEDGSGDGRFTSEITGLEPDTRYYVRAYAVNTEGPGYGNTREFWTEGNAPEVTTAQIDNITYTSATGGGEVTDDGDLEVTERGIVWNTSGNPTIDSDGKQQDDEGGLGEFTLDITDLELGTEYYVRAYAINQMGVGYGNQVTFETLSGHKLTLIADPEVGGELFGEGEFAEGEQVTVTADPTPGYTFIEWTVNGNNVSNSPEFEYEMPAQDVTLTAHFEDFDACDGVSSPNFDGHDYEIVNIGGRCWFAENLRTSVYSGGSQDNIPTDLTEVEWSETTDGAVAVYPHDLSAGGLDLHNLDSDEDVIDAYGKLYNGFAVQDNRNICPDGWKVASVDDWKNIVRYLVVKYNDVNESNVANALKSCRQVGSPEGGDCETDDHPRWDANTSHFGTDKYEFSALPGGERISSGSFFPNMGVQGAWWATTDNNPERIRMRNSTGEVMDDTQDINRGLSVRCVYDGE